MPFENVGWAMKNRWRFWGLTIALIGFVIFLWWADPFHDPYRPGFHDPNPAVRAQAIRDLPFESRDPAVISLLLHDENPDVRMVAAMRMQSWTDGRPLILALKDEHAGVRREAAKALAATADWQALSDALHSEDARVRVGAVQAVLSTGLFAKSYWGKAKPPAFGPMLLDLGKNDPDPSVRLAAEEARGRLVTLEH